MYAAPRSSAILEKPFEADRVGVETDSDALGLLAKRTITEDPLNRTEW